MGFKDLKTGAKKSLYSPMTSIKGTVLKMFEAHFFILFNHIWLIQ